MATCVFIFSVKESEINAFVRFIRNVIIEDDMCLKLNSTNLKMGGIKVLY